MDQTIAAKDVMQGFPPPAAARATRDNWQGPPYNRWAFRNVRQVVPTRPVPRGDGPVWELPSSAQDLSDITFAGRDGATKRLGSYLTESLTDGILVLHRGRLVFERYFDGMTPVCLHLSQSVAKSLVGSLAGILADEGVIAFDRPLQDYVPELAGCGYRDALPAHLLDMASGVRFNEDYEDPASDVSLLEVACGWRPPPPGSDLPEATYDMALTLPQERPHGEAFKYRSIETDVLAWVMECTSGRHLCDLLSARIWSKLGAESDASMTVDAAGTALADGGFNARLRDYARFGRMILEEGAADGRQVVPAGWVDGCFDGSRARPVVHEWRDFPKGGYRRKWWMPDRDRPLLLALGIFGQVIAIDRAHELVVAKLATWQKALDETFAYEDVRMIDAIGRELTDAAGS